MPFVIVHLVGKLKYYVQEREGIYQLNGLVNNAIKFNDEVDVIEATAQLEAMMRKKLVPMEIPPYQHFEEITK